MSGRRGVATLVAIAGAVVAMQVSARPAGAQPALARAAAATGTVDGVVTDTNLVSLADASVSIEGSSIHVATGANGRFRLVQVPAGDYVLVVRRLGYVPVTTALRVNGADTLRLSFALERVTTALDTVMVKEKRTSMKMAEFEQRRKAGFGHFMTQAEIDTHNSAYASDLLQTIPFMAVRRDTRTNRSFAVSERRGCVMPVFLDGVAMPTPFDLDELPSPRELAGIEVYSGPATIPLLYKRSGNNCGILLIWTRDGG